MEQVQERSAVWRERLQTQQASGLTIAGWCKQEGVSAWSFCAWRKRLAEPEPGVSLIAVPLSGTGPMLAMQAPSGAPRCAKGDAQN